MAGAGREASPVGKSVISLRKHIREWHKLSASGVPAESTWGLVEATIETLIFEVMAETLEQKCGAETVPEKARYRSEVIARTRDRDAVPVWRRG
jgi:hypothetical protein